MLKQLALLLALPLLAGNAFSHPREQQPDSTLDGIVSRALESPDLSARFSQATRFHIRGNSNRIPP
jgi:hypothetical protein